MAANWNNPLLTSLYVDFMDELKARDVDVLTMNPGTNLPVDSKRWNAGTNTFQNWNGSAWVNLVLGAAGGGTGSSTPGSLGTMALQNSNAVAITGGTITGVNLNASDITSGILALSRGGTGASLALGTPGSFLMAHSTGIGVRFDIDAGLLANLNAGALNFGNIPIARMPLTGTWAGTGPLVISTPNYLVLNPLQGLAMSTLGVMGAGTINATGYYINGIPLGNAIPTGLMAFFSGACPAGWTFVAASQGRALRSVSGAVGTGGGSDTHTHGFNVPSGGGGAVQSDQPDQVDTFDNTVPGNNITIEDGDDLAAVVMKPGQFSDGFGKHRHSHPHSHNVNTPGYPGFNGDTSPGDSWPSFIEFSLCRKD